MLDWGLTRFAACGRGRRRDESYHTGTDDDSRTFRDRIGIFLLPPIIALGVVEDSNNPGPLHWGQQLWLFCARLCRFLVFVYYQGIFQGVIVLRELNPIQKTIRDSKHDEPESFVTQHPLGRRGYPQVFLNGIEEMELGGRGKERNPLKEI